MLKKRRGPARESIEKRLVLHDFFELHLLAPESKRERRSLSRPLRYFKDGGTRPTWNLRKGISGQTKILSRLSFVVGRRQWARPSCDARHTVVPHFYSISILLHLLLLQTDATGSAPTLFASICTAIKYFLALLSDGRTGSLLQRQSHNVNEFLVDGR